MYNMHCCINSTGRGQTGYYQYQILHREGKDRERSGKHFMGKVEENRNVNPRGKM